MEENLLKARNEKRKRISGESGSSSMEPQQGSESEVMELSGLLSMNEDAIDTEDESVDPSFDLDNSVRNDYDHLIERFCDDWVLQLDRDDKVALGLFLCFQLTKHFEVGETRAAEIAGMMIGRSEKSIREWRSQFFENDGELPESKQGRYHRTGVVWGK